MSTTLSIKKTESISEQLDHVQERIGKRAFEISDGYGHMPGRALDNWLAAEQELIWKPPVELTEIDDEFHVCLAVPGVAPGEIEVEITREHLLVRANSRHEHLQESGGVHVCELESGDLFRSIRFPKSVIPEKAKGVYENGMLHVKAPVAAEAQARKIEMKVA